MTDIIPDLYDEAMRLYAIYRQTMVTERSSIAKIRKARRAWEASRADLAAAGGTPTAIMHLLQERAARARPNKRRRSS